MLLFWVFVGESDSLRAIFVTARLDLWNWLRVKERMKWNQKRLISKVTTPEEFRSLHRGSGSGDGVKIFQKTDPEPESLLIFGSRSVRGIYKCHFLFTHIDEFRLHWSFGELKQNSDSQNENSLEVDLVSSERSNFCKISDLLHRYTGFLGTWSL